MDSIDKLLSQIKADYQTPAKTPQLPKQQPTIAPLKPKSDIDNLLKEVKANLSNLSTKSKSLENNPPVIGSILSQVKANYDKQDQAQAQLKQQQLQAEKLKQIETLKIRAKSWLKQLDPLSTEGLWFERFAEGYQTKVEAAINYLQES